MTPDQVAQAVARVRDEWGPVIQAMAAACQGDAPAADQLSRFFELMSSKADWRNLVAVLRRILAGERDPLALLPGLDDTDVIIAGDVLRGLGVDVPSAGLEETEADSGDMVSLDDFLAMIVMACQPGASPEMHAQLVNATCGMATQPNAPAGLRDLGRVLHAILTGERQPDLSALPPELADKARAVLEELSQ